MLKQICSYILQNIEKNVDQPAHKVHPDVRHWKKGDLLVYSIYFYLNECPEALPYAPVKKQKYKHKFVEFLGFSDSITILYRKVQLSKDGCVSYPNNGGIKRGNFKTLMQKYQWRNSTLANRRWEEKQEQLKQEVKDTSQYQQLLDNFRIAYNELKP